MHKRFYKQTDKKMQGFSKQSHSNTINLISLFSI